MVVGINGFVKKMILEAVICFVIVGFAICIFCWRLPVIWKLNRLTLPSGCETVYKAKVRLSDVYWLHIKGEKVIKCDLGYDAAKEYIITHNSASDLADIDIFYYSGMSDIAIYNSEFDEEFWEQPDADNYIVISYFKKLFEQTEMRSGKMR